MPIHLPTGERLIAHIDSDMGFSSPNFFSPNDDQGLKVESDNYSSQLLHNHDGTFTHDVLNESMCQRPLNDNSIRNSKMKGSDRFRFNNRFALQAGQLGAGELTGQFIYYFSNGGRASVMLTQIGKFAAGGGLGTLCHYVLLWIMVKNHFNPVAASGCGMIAGAVVVYFINYYLTFSSSKKHFDTMKRFLPMASLGFCLNGLILGCALEYFALPLPLSQVMATAGQFLFGFTISSLWVF